MKLENPEDRASETIENFFNAWSGTGDEPALKGKLEGNIERSITGLNETEIRIGKPGGMRSNDRVGDSLPVKKLDGNDFDITLVSEDQLCFAGLLMSMTEAEYVQWTKYVTRSLKSPISTLRWEAERERSIAISLERQCTVKLRQIGWLAGGRVDFND